MSRKSRDNVPLGVSRFSFSAGPETQKSSIWKDMDALRGRETIQEDCGPTARIKHRSCARHILFCAGNAPRNASESAKSTSAGPHAAFFQHSSLRCRKPLSIDVQDPVTP